MINRPVATPPSPVIPPKRPTARRAASRSLLFDWTRRPRPWMALLVLILCAPVVLGQKTDRAKQVGRRMMCQCGCNQILSECNHIGCWSSSEMLKKVDARVAAGESDDKILEAFVAEYGVRALAEPPKTGFGRVAWIMPWVTTLGGLAIVWLVLARMRRLVPAVVPAAAVARASADGLDRFRQQADRESEE